MGYTLYSLNVYGSTSLSAGIKEFLGRKTPPKTMINKICIPCTVFQPVQGRDICYYLCPNTVHCTLYTVHCTVYTSLILFTVLIRFLRLSPRFYSIVFDRVLLQKEFMTSLRLETQQRLFLGLHVGL